MTKQPQEPPKKLDGYDIYLEFSAGFVAAIKPEGIDRDKSSHWKAGYEAGCLYRNEKNQLLDEYLVSLGLPKVTVFRQC